MMLLEEFVDQPHRHIFALDGDGYPTKCRRCELLAEWWDEETREIEILADASFCFHGVNVLNDCGGCK